MTDLLHEKLKVLLIRDREADNPCMVEICDCALRVIAADKRGFAPQYLEGSLGDE